MSRQKAIKASHVMTTRQAQDLLDRNAETMKEIIKLQGELEAAPAGALTDAAERKERLLARLHRRLLKLSRWCDTSEAERKRSDEEFEQKQQKVRWWGRAAAHGSFSFLFF
jgi:hypothetical protein